jgi:hypothetical protein
MDLFVTKRRIVSAGGTDIMAKYHNSTTAFIQQYPDLVSAKAISVRYGVNKCRVSGIINTPTNDFPNPEIIGYNGRRRLYCPHKVERWLGGRYWLQIPYTEGVYNTQNKKRTGSTYKAVNDYGVGGKAEGEFLKIAVEFYRALSSQ